MRLYAETLLRTLSSWLAEYTKTTSFSVALVHALASLVVTLVFVYALLVLLAPVPRAPTPSEKTYITINPSGEITPPRPLPCWYDAWQRQRNAARMIGNSAAKHTGTIEPPEVVMSVVIPAYNEEKRLEIMLAEAVAFLDAEYGRGSSALGPTVHPTSVSGYEILLVNDGSSDATVEVALAFARTHNLHDTLRICSLTENRGKGGAVTHGLRHVRGSYAAFADADGASRFSDLRHLVNGCTQVADASGRAISVGSRAHLVCSEAVVKRSALRNILMHSFHLLLRLLTPPATARIRDTQCGFKLFTRAALPHIVPYMHAEGWIFDVEMLMLAESAPPAFGDAGDNTPASSGIRVQEVYISWKEVEGSKLNVLWASLGMAFGLALLRASWLLGVYRRR
ncbi:hypothetical protein K3495_g1130 [Podosphaera aphanis]|nr:hypothetical protein K3495_g1130 [Podosphaera aphanis]